jgi:NADPH2:quinone reductase
VAVRAIQMTEFGGPEVLKLAELPRPEPGPGEVAIRVTRAGLNFADTHTRTNSYVRKAELPLVPGGEVAGVLEETGERVLALVGSGGYAEYVTAPRDRVFPIPEDVEDGTALALLIQGTTAWHLLRSAARLAEGESVVIHSAAGGVGSLTTQLARCFGAGRIIATASSEDKRELALGDGRQLDVVIDSSGGQVFDASIKALAPFGRIVVNGIATSEQNTVRTGSLLRHSRAVIGFYLFHCLERPGMFEQALQDLFDRVRRAELRVVVGRTYPLQQAAQAQVDLRERRTTGKLLLDPSA